MAGTGSGCPAHPTRAEGHEELQELTETCRKAGPWGLEGRLQHGPPGTQEGVCHRVRARRLACDPKDLHSARADRWLSLTREISGVQWGWGRGPRMNTPLSSGSQKAMSSGTPISLIKLSCPGGRLSQSRKQKWELKFSPAVNMENPSALPRDPVRVTTHIGAPGKVDQSLGTPMPRSACEHSLREARRTMWPLPRAAGPLPFDPETQLPKPLRRRRLKDAAQGCSILSHYLRVFVTKTPCWNCPPRV